MTVFLISLAAVIVAGFFGSLIVALVRSLGGQARDEEAFGAPEGASNFQFQYPSISGSTLSVRVSSKQSVSPDLG